MDAHGEPVSWWCLRWFRASHGEQPQPHGMPLVLPAGDDDLVALLKPRCARRGQCPPGAHWICCAYRVTFAATAATLDCRVRCRLFVIFRPHDSPGRCLCFHAACQLIPAHSTTTGGASAPQVATATATAAAMPTPAALIAEQRAALDRFARWMASGAQLGRCCRTARRRRITQQPIGPLLDGSHRNWWQAVVTSRMGVPHVQRVRRDFMRVAAAYRIRCTRRVRYLATLLSGRPMMRLRVEIPWADDDAHCNHSRRRAEGGSGVARAAIVTAARVRDGAQPDRRFTVVRRQCGTSQVVRGTPPLGPRLAQ